MANSAVMTGGGKQHWQRQQHEQQYNWKAAQRAEMISVPFPPLRSSHNPCETQVELIARRWSTAPKVARFLLWEDLHFKPLLECLGILVA